MTNRLIRYTLNNAIIIRVLAKQNVNYQYQTHAKLFTKVICSLCKVVLEPGDSVCSKPSYMHKKLYHEKCYDGMFT